MLVSTMSIDNPRTCKKCGRNLSWNDLKHFTATVGPMGLLYYGGYVCFQCLLPKESPDGPAKES